MANFFFTGGEQGFMAINIDLVRMVIDDRKAKKITLHFDKEQKVDFPDDQAPKLRDMLTQLRSEANEVLSGKK